MANLKAAINKKLDEYQQAQNDADSVGKQLGEKQRMINEVATPTRAASAPPEKQPSAPVDKVNPSAQYGDRGKEKRIDTSTMVKPLGSFKSGTDYVPKTGVYQLHEGEGVLTKEENMKHQMKAAEHDLGGEPKKPAKKVKEIRTRKAKNGGYIHEHHHVHPEHHPMEEHTSADPKAMADHMMQNMGDDAPASEAADGTQGAPEGPTGSPDINKML